MELKKINEILSDLDNITSKKDVKLISRDQPKGYGEEQYDRTELQKVEIFDIDEDGIFLKIVTTVDSYGSNERISGIQFVKPIKKEITVYE